MAPYAPHVPSPIEAAHERMFDTASIPAEVRLAADRQSLTLAWDDADDARVAASTLRLACRCAWCTRARFDGRFVQQADGVQITAVEPMGDYALRLFFSDGHDRGIFPWTFIAALAGAAPVSAGRPPSSSAPQSQGQPA